MVPVLMLLTLRHCLWETKQVTHRRHSVFKLLIIKLIGMSNEHTEMTTRQNGNVYAHLETMKKRKNTIKETKYTLKLINGITLTGITCYCTNKNLCDLLRILMICFWPPHPQYRQRSRLSLCWRKSDSVHRWQTSQKVKQQEDLSSI